jgi:hypothetical protein
MKKNVQYVDARLIQVALISAGFTEFIAQKGFVKVPLGPKGRTLYIAKTKEVGRVDISGFEVDLAEYKHVRSLGGESFGNVKQQVNFDKEDSRTPEAIIATIVAVAEKGKSLGDAPVKAKSNSSSPDSSQPEPAGWMNDDEKTKAIADRAARLALIQHVAEQHVVPVSDKTLAEMDASSQNLDEMTEEELELATA